jgi:hypothetical protein
MNPEEIAQKYDDALAEKYIQRALKEGRSEDDGLDDYLEKELGIRRPERTDEVLREIDEMRRRRIEKFLNGLADIASRAAILAPASLPMIFIAASSYVDDLIDRIENSTDPKMKAVQKWLKTHKDELMAELSY